MIIESNGNLFNSGANVLVNAVNTVGVMGGGIAAEFKRKYPDYFAAYKVQCDLGYLSFGGQIIEYAVSDGFYILSLASKKHWRNPSKYSYVCRGIQKARLFMDDYVDECKSIAIPALGCGLGGLDWNVVRPLIEEAFEGYEGTVYLYSPK